MSHLRQNKSKFAAKLVIFPIKINSSTFPIRNNGFRHIHRTDRLLIVVEEIASKSISIKSFGALQDLRSRSGERDGLSHYDDGIISSDSTF